MPPCDVTSGWVFARPLFPEISQGTYGRSFRLNTLGGNPAPGTVQTTGEHGALETSRLIGSLWATANP